MRLRNWPRWQLAEPADTAGEQRRAEPAPRIHPADPPGRRFRPGAAGDAAGGDQLPEQPGLRVDLPAAVPGRGDHPPYLSQPCRPAPHRVGSGPGVRRRARRFPGAPGKPRRARQAIAVGWPERPLEYADLAGDAAAEVLLFHPTERRGWLRPGRLRVESRFPLGLLVAWSWVDLRQQALVYPRPLAGESFLAPGAEDAENQGRAGERGRRRLPGAARLPAGRLAAAPALEGIFPWPGLLVKDFAALGGKTCGWNSSASAGTSKVAWAACAMQSWNSERQQPWPGAPGTRLQPASGEAQREACLRALALFGAAR